MRLSDIIQPLHMLSNDEQFTLVRQMRRRRFYERPVAKKQVERKQKKERRSSGNKARDLVSALSAEDRKKLIEELR